VLHKDTIQAPPTLFGQSRKVNSQKFAKKVPEITHLGEAPASSPLLWFSETRVVPSGTPRRMGKEPQTP
jgi:hypothetical protein